MITHPILTAGKTLVALIAIPVLLACGPRADTADVIRSKTDSTIAAPIMRADTDTIVLPKEMGVVTDYAQLFSPSEMQSLSKIVSDFEKRSSVEIAVLTVPAAFLDSLPIEKFSLAVFNQWGIGKKGLNNGILICICAECRTIRIENGLGIEKVLTNDETSLILQTQILPYFKKNEYFNGTKNGILKIIETLDSKDHSTLYKQ